MSEPISGLSWELEMLLFAIPPFLLHFPSSVYFLYLNGIHQ